MADDMEETEYRQFLLYHEAQLEASEIPQRYWRTLYTKIQNETYDAGSYFTMMHSEEEGTWKVLVSSEEGLQASDPNSVFLVDHAWTYTMEHARAQLEAIPGLLDRMANLMEVKAESQEQLVEQVLEGMWCFNNSYKLRMMAISDGNQYELQRDAENQVPLFYIMDEFGSRIQHCDVPTLVMKLFYYVPMKVSFNVIWPLRDLVCGEEATRDFQPEVKEPLLRTVCLLPWYPKDLTLDFSSLSIHNVEENMKLPLDQDRCNELLPSQSSQAQKPRSPRDGVYHVFTDLVEVNQFLTDPKFILVDSEDEADIIWIRNHFKDFRSLQENGKYVSQFPSENVLTCKDLLARICQVATPSTNDEEDLHIRGPLWIPVTYYLNGELPQFVQHYLKRKEKGMDNHWIVKPSNLGRGMDMHITSNLNYLVRLVETGPKVACKYLENPVLFDREDVGLVKCDIRYLVLLTSVDPLVLHVDKVFWLRFANKPFSMDHFDDYMKHYTVMNYKASSQLKQIHHHEFIPMFEKQYPDHKWEKIEAKIFKAFKEMFKAATKHAPPNGFGHFSQSRAFYAVDLMLKWAEDGSNEMVPQILEVNFNPDCARACKYYPDFFNYIFSFFFFGDSCGWPLERL